jgi:hypothetical protein
MSMPQPLDRIEFAEREFEGYKEYVEDWKRKHDELAAHCWAVEDVVSKANYVHTCIVRVAAELLQFSASEQASEVYVRIHHLLREWLRFSLVLEECVRGLEGEYGQVHGAVPLRHNIGLARDEITLPSPVTIDSDGSVYEMTGDRAVMPGLDPARVLRGIKDGNAGRTRSLKDIIAGRAGNGI